MGGWAIYEIIDEPEEGSAYFAERYWWNRTLEQDPNEATWLDFTPRPEGVEELLLAAAYSVKGPGEEQVLTAHHETLANHLMQLRFPSEVDKMKQQKGPV